MGQPCLLVLLLHLLELELHLSLLLFMPGSELLHLLLLELHLHLLLLHLLPELLHLQHEGRPLCHAAMQWGQAGVSVDMVDMKWQQVH